MNKAELTNRLNELGVLCRHQVSGVQYQFKLNLDDLSPKSAIFVPNKGHIRDTVYTLIPEKDAAMIARIGRSLFDRLSQYLPGKTDEADFAMTMFGRYVSVHAVRKLERAVQSAEREMRSLARELIRGKYKEYYSMAFRLAYSFFENKNEDFREALRIFDSSGGLVWGEVNRIYRELAEWEAEYKTPSSRRRLKVQDIDSPEGKTAFRLSRIPKSEEEYVSSINCYLDFFAFHPDLSRIAPLPTKSVPDSFARACLCILRMPDKLQ
ncbi:MAG: hypothetical protein WEF53_01610 [Bacteroidota bacterium]